MALCIAAADRETRLCNGSFCAFRNLVSRNLDLVHRLELQRKLEGHDGCVNTCSFSPSGDILVSGSDDQNIVFWDWATGRTRLTFASGHTNNVFQARMMSFSNDNVIISAAADGQVRVNLLKGDGPVGSHMVFRHSGRAHKLDLDPLNPTCFYSCGEDGVVNHIDLRESLSKPSRRSLCVPRSSPGSSYHSASATELNAIHVNPSRPCQFAVGGSDEYVRVFDCRQLCQARAGRHATSLVTIGHAEPLLKLCPAHLVDGGCTKHITCVKYSRYGELLATYNNECIYLFEPVQAEPGRPAKASGEDDDAQPVDQAAGPSTAWRENDTDHVAQRYRGHRNRRTVKGVSFLGADDEYVLSGSDCGHVFVWGKDDARLQALLHGDEDVVNCLEPHPFLPHTFATSGIDHDIKIWAPTAAEAKLPGEEAQRLMEANQQPQRGRREHVLRMSPDTLLALLRFAMPSGSLPGSFFEVDMEPSGDSPRSASSSGVADDEYLEAMEDTLTRSGDAGEGLDGEF